MQGHLNDDYSETCDIFKYSCKSSRMKFLAAIDRLSVLFGWPRAGSAFRCFINLRPVPGGPGYFVGKLMDQFLRQGISTTHRRLRSSQGALLFSVSWGDWFHRLCRRWGVHTVLRVDGFYLPNYFDNRSQPLEFQDRHLSLNMMAVNSRMQRDLLLSNFVIYQSAFSKEMADRFLYTRRDAYAIVFNGVDLEQFRPGTARNGRRCLLSCGTIRDEYMMGSVLPVFKVLWREYDLDLLIVGPLDPVNQKMLEEFKQGEPEARQRIDWVGPVLNRDMPKLMQRADILIHPRLGDWCPNTVVEAMACGLPVVCGSWGGTAELVGDAGMVVPTGPWEYGQKFVKGLAEGVAQILGDLDRYKAAARARAEAEFDIRCIAKKYLQAMGLDGSL